MNILVVDDAVFMRNMLADTLESNGHKVVGHASDGHEAVDLYKRLKPHIVTMDITMPNCDGLDALRQIMEYDADAHVLICSAVGHKQNVVQAIQIGAKNFIVKPFIPEKLLQMIDTMGKKIIENKKKAENTEKAEQEASVAE